MDGRIYAFKGEGVADQAANRRHGARHALMIFVRCLDIETAEMQAFRIAAEKGWDFVTLQKGGEVTIEPSEVTEQYLRAALVDAIQGGSSMVTYNAELPPNS
ncbi:hypothetical protein [Novosphingobium sp. FKTRR1]|uniref:hypothetical protein n=1 Tax=Novosphingobium sp. FKTRR1 TaxID=2879118 RepID=UPI001CEFE73D|nr:hypothetical protein [Novosphingobium sp. FKTRR1]